MEPEVVLCVDSESVRNPDLIGLDGENLLAQPWLRLFCSAVEARSYLRKNEHTKEVWVASSDDVDPINLAAALKKDSASKEILMLAFEKTGSLKSRASVAGLDGALSRQEFTSRYAGRKRQHSRGSTRAGQTIEAPPGQLNCAGIVRPAQDFQARELPSGWGKQAVLLPVREEGISDRPSHIVPPGTKKVEAGKNEQYGIDNGLWGADSDEGVSHPGKIASLTADERGKPRHAPGHAPAVSGRSAFLLSVVSASGGTGKSTIAALSALFAQGLGYNTLLLDADMQFGDMPFLLGVENPLTLEDVRADPSRLSSLRSDGSKPALLAAPQHLELAESVVSDLPQLIDYLKPRFDLIIVNTGSFWTESHALLLERSSCALFLVDQRPTSLRASKHAIELCARCGIATNPFLFAINRCSRNATFSSIDVSCALGGARSIELRDGGREVDELLGAGMPFELINTKNDLCVSLEHALVELLPKKMTDEIVGESSSLAEPRRFTFGKRKRRAACL